MCVVQLAPCGVANIVYLAGGILRVSIHGAISHFVYLYFARWYICTLLSEYAYGVAILVESIHRATKWF